MNKETCDLIFGGIMILGFFIVPAMCFTIYLCYINYLKYKLIKDGHASIVGD